MPSFTPNLNLYLPGGGSESIGGSDEAADIDKLNKNFQKLDKYAWVRGGTAAQRGAIPLEERRAGLAYTESDTGLVWMWLGSRWAVVSDTSKRVLSGREDLTGFTGPNTRVEKAITFPAGTFSGTPAVTVSSDASAPQNVIASSRLASATGVTLVGWRNDSVPYMRIHWVAVGPA